MKIRTDSLKLSVILLIVVIIFVAIDQTNSQDTPEVDNFSPFIVNTVSYLKSVSGTCFAYQIVINGVTYFQNGGEQIADYTNAFDYLLDGLKYIDDACYRK